MHGKLDLTNAKGLKKSEIRFLSKLLQKRIPKDKILTMDLADTVAEISNSTGHNISVVLNRHGQVVNITVGQPGDVNMPELRGVRVGPGRLCGHRIIHTNFSKGGKSSQEYKTKPGEAFSKENLNCLAKNRLDLLAQIDVNPDQTFNKSKGEQAYMADAVHIAHLMPGRDSEGKIYKILPPQTTRSTQEDDFQNLIGSLEDEFRVSISGTTYVEGEERAILVDLITEGANAFEIEDDLDELALLARTAGATICGRMTQARQKPHPNYFLGSGKVQEVALLVQEMGANLVVVDKELSPTQAQNLTEMIGVKVVDRTELILDIFAQRAQTKEGKLQVELAQLKYLYPRLVGKGQILSRLGGGIGTRGPGETKLEIDRRVIRDRINQLEKETARIKNYRETQRRQRISLGLPVIALTGYTNSGKSTLINSLTKSSVFVEDKLFATLDPTTRKSMLPDGSPILISDTVGFIKKLPTSLVNAFKATLEEVAVADILVHVVDASHPNVEQQIASVFDILSELEAVDKPIITVLNKADKVRREDLEWLFPQVINPVIVSATQKVGLQGLLLQIQKLVQDVCPNRRKFSA